MTRPPTDPTITTCESISKINAHEWNALAGDNPFVSHAFLDALEYTRCAAAESGWQPMHLAARHHGRLIGAMPLYLKHHSSGEYVFDAGWAQAYQQHGLSYYPKLLCAAPFSPVTGPRLLGAHSAAPALAQGATKLAQDHGLSSAHCLFPHPREAKTLIDAGWLLRTGCQFHWHNHDYADFDAFLATFRAAKRKKLRRERRRITDATINFRILHGNELDEPLLDDIYRFYSLTYLERGRLPYLNRPFFASIAARLGSSMVIIIAQRETRPIAAAICFRSHDTLYGRHWGADEHWHSLHFETCYYQGIEYCIRERLHHFDPGAQGEHKLSRGFEPTQTVSAHWIANPKLRAAIAGHLARERPFIDHYIANAREHLPFK